MVNDQHEREVAERREVARPAIAVGQDDEPMADQRDTPTPPMASHRSGVGTSLVGAMARKPVDSASMPTPV